MECILRAGALKTLIDCTKDLVTSANFSFDEDGMRVQAMDISHVSLILLALKPSAFASYRCNTQTTLGIHFEALAVVLKSCMADDMLTLTYGHGVDRLTIARGADRVFELKLLDIDDNTLLISEQGYDFTATVPSSDFQKLCRDLKEIGDSVRIDASTDSITLSVEGDAMVGKATATLKDGVSIEEGGKSTSSSYGARYLAAFSRGASLCSYVRIQMSADTPLRLTFGCDGEQLTCFLAARICD